MSAPLPKRQGVSVPGLPRLGALWLAQMPWALIQLSVPLNFFQAHLLLLQSQWPFKSQGLALWPHRLSGSVSLLPALSPHFFVCLAIRYTQPLKMHHGVFNEA